METNAWEETCVTLTPWDQEGYSAGSQITGRHGETAKRKQCDKRKAAIERKTC